MRLLLHIEADNGLEPILKEFGPGVYRIGRSEFCDLVLEGKDISRSHLELRVTESAVYITNMSSTGQVKLNGERVETGEIKDGDRIQLGGHTVLFQIKSDDLPVSNDPPVPAFPQFEIAEEPEELQFGSPDAPAPKAEVGAEIKEFPLEPQYASREIQVEGALALKTENTDLENQAVVAKLIFTEGPLAGSEIPVQGYEMTMGRSRKADIYLADDKLSRKHAKISRVGQGYRLIDLQSRNGTYVNGVRVLEHPLNSFDVVELGRTKFKFLILDVEVGGLEQGGPIQLVDRGDPTKSIQLVAEPHAAPPEEFSPRPKEPAVKKGGLRKNIILIGAVLILVAVLLNLPKGENQDVAKTPTGEAIPPAKITGTADANLPPAMPPELSDLTPEAQRKAEGHYNTALRYQAKEDFENAYTEIKELHKMLPYYKESKKLEGFLIKKLKEKQKEVAIENMSKNRNAEIQIYLEEGLEYLKQGDFARAEEAFNNILVLDPTNDTAAKGVRAAQLKIKDIEQLPPEVDPEMEKRKLVAQLLEQAVARFEERAYQETINLAEKARMIEIKGETEYLNQAKQLIDKARLQQKEEFEPFLIQAKEKFAEGDYNLSRDLCDEMLKRDKSYDAAQECSLRARKQLNRLAKEAYTHGYILESMNRIEEAKQYWNRAKNYVRPGDPYFEKIQRKLDSYQ